MLAATLLLCASPVVTDGDSIRCADGVRIRLTGIDAPDTPAYCKRKGRVCTKEQWQASKDSLKAVVGTQDIHYDKLKIDLYGRTVAEAFAGGVNLSCHQIAQGQAAYVERWGGKELKCRAKPGKRKDK